MKNRQPIPVIERYRGVGLHADQDELRLCVVRADIDAVYEMQDDLAALKKWISNHSRAPESRLLGASLIEATFEEAVAHGRARPDVDLLWVRAVVAGLDNSRQRDFYDSIWAPRPPRGYADRAIRRSRPLVV